jgi:chemosensory pili system protein ChpA (sensor histidine kinase/response regulator)
VPLARLEELVRLVSELVVHRGTFEQHFGDLTREVGELDLSVERLRRLAGRLETEYEVAALSGGRSALRWAAAGGGALPATEAFDPLELDRYTEFHLLSRELTETGADIATLGGELGGTLGDFDGYLGRLARLTSEAQDKLMRLRMVPLASLASRLHRAVRVTAAQQGKAADLTVEGGAVELDKTVLEEMADPLLHLLRNAVDHGIEPPALRRALGKPERGAIAVKAFHEGTQVVIRISDDGAGIEPEVVRRAAVEGGYLSEAEAAAKGPDEVLSLVFLPGFSTAGRVSEVSGRGIGLDVVHSTVARLKGSLALASTPGQGTALTIRLPMTLAILRVLMVEAAGQTFAVPLPAVAQILRLSRQEIEQVGQEPVVRVGGRVVPLLRLAHALRLPEVVGEEPERVPALVLSLGERQVALAVDRLVEAREVVVKPLGSHLRQVTGVTGATLLGDGSVVLIVNPSELAERAADALPEALPRAHHRPAAAALDLLIVDDSLSVRRVLANLMRSAGWNAIPARDGVEALEILQRAARAPDAILLDLEMPRMDGYELAATLKAQDAFRHIPIVVVTSRAGDKHRARALSLGVDEYLVKPYQDETLLAIVRRLTRGEHRAAAP